MKNNTKLIMETWRRFLNEGDQNEEGQYSDPDETVPPLPPVEEDPDLSGDVPQRNNLPFDDEYNPDGDLDSELADDIERIDSESEREMDMPGEGFEDLPHEGDNIEYSRRDAQMSPSERYAAQEERDALSDPNVDEFGNEQENPFAYDDGPY